MPKYVLGSSSAWRRIVMLKYFKAEDFTQMSPDIDEKAIRHPDAEILCLMVARGKLEALLPRIGDEHTIVICSDQVVRFDGNIREKPVSTEENKEFLRSYGDASPQTVCGIVVCNTATGKRAEGVDIATVNWAPIPEEVIEKVVAKGESMTCCGGFVVEDPDLQPYLKSIDGTLDSIEGLPIDLLRRLIREVE